MVRVQLGTRPPATAPVAADGLPADIQAWSPALAAGGQA